MALETLKGVEQVNGYPVASCSAKNPAPEGSFIRVNHETNDIAFSIQNGPVKEVGVNGCQVDEIIAVARIMLAGLNRNYHCVHNDYAIDALDTALARLAERKADRERRGVEGTSSI